MLTRRLRPVFVAALVAAGLISGALPADSARADDIPGSPKEPAVTSTQQGTGIAVSWMPTTSPVQTRPGTSTRATFWVTNHGTTPVPVTILSATAVPGDNGDLDVQAGSDERFPVIRYSPDRFVAQPLKTTAITVTTIIPATLGPGVYIIPAMVHPEPARSSGNIRTQVELIALTTFQVPGAIDARLQPTFVDPERSSGSLVSHRFPGLPQIQIGPRGQKVLRVLNASPSSLYAYNEIIATQQPLGEATFAGHTQGAPGNLRTEPALYFSGLHRDYPLSWTASPFGIGVAHLKAYVSYHADPTTLSQTSTSTHVVLISPWWLFGVVLCLAMLLRSMRASTRSRRNTGRGRRRQQPARSTRRRPPARGIAGWGLLTCVVVTTALFSSPLIFALLGGTGLVSAAAGGAVLRRRGAEATARGLQIYLGATALLLVGASTMLLLAALSVSPIGAAIDVLAGAGTWTLAAWIAQWWTGTQATPAPDDQVASGPPVPLVNQ